MYPEGFQSGQLQQIREHYAAMAEAVKAAPALPATGARGCNTAAKRAAEVAGLDSMQGTVKSHRRLQGPADSKQSARAAATDASADVVVVAAAAGAAAAAAAPVVQAVVDTASEPLLHQQQQHFGGGAAKAAVPALFNGRPLETPMPFAGEAAPLPVTLLARRRGGRTAAVPAPDAAVITTADGRQWALGREGMAAIPETHRSEVESLLTAQWEFLAAALGKTIFSRKK